MTDQIQRKRVWASHPLSHPSAAAFSPSEALLVIKSTWGEIALLSVEGGEKLFAMRPKRQDEGLDLIISAEGSLLVDGSWSGGLRIR